MIIKQTYIKSALPMYGIPKEREKELLAILNRWQDTPTALNYLEAIDACVYKSLGADPFLSWLQQSYEVQLRADGLTHEEVSKKADWRKRDD